MTVMLAIVLGVMSLGTIIFLFFKKGKKDCGIEIDRENDLYIPTVGYEKGYVSNITRLSSQEQVISIRTYGTLIQHQRAIEEWKRKQ